MCFNKMNGHQVEIAGVATLCFDGEGTWFQGSIISEDDTQYAIYGTKSKWEDHKQDSKSKIQGISSLQTLFFAILATSAPIPCDINTTYVII